MPFIAPAKGLEGTAAPHEALGIQIYSGFHADLRPFAGQDPTFDEIARKRDATGLVHEDQCSPQHYFDIFRCVKRFVTGAKAPFSQLRVVDVGVFMGGSSTVLAGCVPAYGISLDLVDTNEAYLQFAYERIRRSFPEASQSIRMFLGDLPTYVLTVLMAETNHRTLIHHDGSHEFGQVVKDLASLWYVRDRVHGVVIQDTHLRSANVEFMNFVDAAVYGVFGKDVDYTPVGARYPAGNTVTEPNKYQGNYFLPGEPEGMEILFSRNRFRYPHPSMAIERFLVNAAN